MDKIKYLFKSFLKAIDAIVVFSQKFYTAHKQWIDRFWHTFIIVGGTTDMAGKLKIIIASPSSAALIGLVSAVGGVLMKALFYTQLNIDPPMAPKNLAVEVTPPAIEFSAPLSPENTTPTDLGPQL